MSVISDHCDVKIGQSAPQDKSAFSDTGMPFVRAGSLEGLLAGESLDSLEQINEDNAQKYKMKIFPKGSSLFPKSGMSAKIGRVYKLPKPAFVVSHLAGVIPNANIDQDYLFRWWEYKNPATLISNDAYPSIKKSQIEAVPFYPPSLSEQKRIAAVLDQADALRQKRKQSIDYLNQLGQSIFYEMFGDPRTNPMNFQKIQFGKFADVKLGKMLDKGKKRGNLTKKYLRNANVRWFSFDLADLNEMEFYASELDRFKVVKGDLLICEGGEPGRCAVWYNEDCDIFYQKALHRARLDQSVAIPEYVSFWFFLAANLSMLSDSVTSATIAHLTGQKIKKLEIMVPSLDLQSTFLKKLSCIEDRKQNFSTALTGAETIFASLQQRAFRGEL